MQHIRDLNTSTKPKPFQAITSTPCFEFWLLLHFGFTARPFHSAGKKSVGDMAVAELKLKPGFKDYEKGKQGIYTALKGDKLTDAIKAAAQLRKSSTATGNSNPATDVDLLVLELQALASGYKK